ncbi:nickel pincer cofactor biosynthesis protein LarC [Cellulomonas aerilata]|uniref:Pyridinium-3,5-bisthiocarboxylic acid mononucleotide nickel insertion protein n=1 Tax=Cellulomonas aerilata TaxID=515326 RepID=A0A512D9I4_9CELL|nr:nickel pincer cofactor biosynthesis protein LarC [Cellulomonas aerilata]GEO33148.1 UPF0272 protein Cgl2470/cg2715 [Cellulomonas aerilata]
MTPPSPATSAPTPTLLWIDASAGIAGDMLLGALVDAGAALDDLQSAVDAVIPGSVRLAAHGVTRAGLRATKVEVEVLVDDPPHRTWTTIRDLLVAADLAEPVRARALAAFARLAEAEGRVHGIPPEDVHFHEVGALDAIADVVGSCAGVEALGVTDAVVSPIALGSGTVTAHHGVLPVPAPAALELSRGWDVLAGGRGELATPTGLALATSLAGACGPLPALRPDRTGIGAGTRDTPGRANVVRVVLGTPTRGTTDAPVVVPADAGPGGTPERAVVLETNVDDLDPRVWPDVLERLLAAGAWDAWLTPIVMKKGRPAHTLHVLCGPEQATALGAVVLAHTSTLGLRVTSVVRDVLDRAWVAVEVDGGTVRVKVGHRAGRVVQATPEFGDVAALAADRGVPVRQVLAQAQAAATAAGVVQGAPWDPVDGGPAPA